MPKDKINKINKNEIEGNLTIPDNLANYICPAMTCVLEFLENASKNIALTEYTEGAKKCAEFNGGPVYPNIRSHSQPLSPVTAARVCAYAFSILTTGAAVVRQDVHGCCGNPSGLSLLLPGAAANKQMYKRRY